MKVWCQHKARKEDLVDCARSLLYTQFHGIFTIRFVAIFYCNIEFQRFTLICFCLNYCTKEGIDFV